MGLQLVREYTLEARYSRRMHLRRGGVVRWYDVDRTRPGRTPVVGHPGWVGTGLALPKLHWPVFLESLHPEFVDAHVLPASLDDRRLNHATTHSTS